MKRDRGGLPGDRGYSSGALSVQGRRRLSLKSLNKEANGNFDIKPANPLKQALCPNFPQGIGANATDGMRIKILK